MRRQLGSRSDLRPWLAGRLRLARRRSLGNELALLFFAVTALSLAVLFSFVVPQLESNLELQQIRDLERSAVASSDALEQAGRDQLAAPALDRRVREAAEVADARVTLLGVQQSPSGPRREPPRFYVVSDSEVGPALPADLRQAERAVLGGGGRIYTGRGVGDRGGAAQAARQLYYFGRPNWVALYTRDLEGVAQAVSLVQARILAASGVALVVALLGSWLVGRAIARRVRRLEEAARELAAGHPVEPLPETADDELGRLTRAFNDMQQQLGRVDRARSDFIANASHELRTPIFSLSGFVELLQDEDLEPEVREEFLSAMREQVGRLQKLAVDLLDLSRLDAGALSLSPEPVPLGPLAREVLREFGPAFARHGAALQEDLPEQGVEALCDRERVAQIARILLDNAVRHTPRGTRVRVSARCHEGECELTVADDGPGPAPGDGADQLFQRFYTGAATSGSGLGLAIARELAERMGGRIELRAEGRETAFALTLPSAGREAPELDSTGSELQQGAFAQ